MFTDNLDNMSWICGYQSKKEEVLSDYEQIIKNLTQITLNQVEPQEWNFEITTQKIRFKNPSEEFNLLKKGQKEMPNIILSTLLNHVIAYTDFVTKRSLIYYYNPEKQKDQISSEFLFSC